MRCTRLHRPPSGVDALFDLVPQDVLLAIVELPGRLELAMFKCTCRAAWAAVRRVEVRTPRRPVRCCNLAAEGGHLQLLQWLLQQGCPIDQATRVAAYAGQLHVLEWMVKAGILPVSGLGDVMIGAASQGHVHVLEWLAPRVRLPGDWRVVHDLYQTRNTETTFVDRMVSSAAYNGHVDVLRWARGRNYTSNDVGFWASVRRDAVATGNWHVVHWIDAVRPMCRAQMPDPLCYALVLTIGMVYAGLIQAILLAW